METLKSQAKTDQLTMAPPANDDCLRIPVMGTSVGYRRSTLPHPQSRRTAAAVLLAVVFCMWWVGMRGAGSTEVEAVRTQVQSVAGPVALSRFDARLAGLEDPSLLRLHLLRISVAG